MTYFQRHRQRIAQWNPRRRNGHTDSGVVVVHTFEAPAGRTCAWGARYLTIRTTYGSYHWLGDALGDTEHLAPWSGETWHETTVNNHGVGISMMAYAADWKKISATHRRNLVNGAALGAHRYSRWRVSTGRSPVPARRITRAQALAKIPGFIGHGEIDTARRTDPGRHFPWDEFLAEYARLERSSGVDSITIPTDREDDFDMSTPIKLSPAAQSALVTNQETWTAGDLLAVLAHRIGLIHQRVEVLRDDSPKIKTAIQEIQELSRVLPRVADKVEKTNHATGRIERAFNAGTTEEG